MTSARRSPSRWQIGSLAGIPVYLGASWLLVAAVITVLFGPFVTRVLPTSGLVGYAVAAGFSILLLLSVLVHEAAHAVVARLLGFTVQRIVADFWGGHTAYHGDTSRPGASALVAVAGPVANLVLAGAGWLFVQDLDRGVVWLLVTAFTTANAFVGLFNLLPGLPLDGGYLLEAVVWKLTASRGLGSLTAGWSGRMLVVLLLWWAVGIPLVAGRSVGLFRLVWVVAIAVFLWVGATRAVRAGRAQRRFERTTVASVWRHVGQVPQEARVGQVDWTRSPLWVVTGPGGEPTGIVDEEALSRVQAGGAPDTRVCAIAIAQPPGWVVDTAPEESVLAVVSSMQQVRSPVAAIRLPNGQVPAVVFAADL